MADTTRRGTDDTNEPGTGRAGRGRRLVPAGPAYRTGCAEVAGYCNAAGVLASVLIGYGNVDLTPFV